MAYIQSSQLDVGVLVAYPLLQRTHSIFRLHCLGPNNVGYLEVEGHVLPARHQHLSPQLPRQSSSTHKLEVVARSICSSSALLVDDPNQPAMVCEGEVGVWAVVRRGFVNPLCAAVLHAVCTAAQVFWYAGGRVVLRRRCSGVR